MAQSTREIVLHSTALGADRKIWVNTPVNYSLKKDSLHLLLLLDGDNRSLFNFTVAAKRFLEENATDLSDFKAPPSIIVGIQQAADRWEDFGDSLLSPKFLSFLEKEVIPYVRSNYRTVSYMILIGHSLGGRFAIETWLNRPGLFNAIIAASPAFRPGDFETIQQKLQRFGKTPPPLDQGLYFSTTYLKDDMTESEFRGFSERLASWFKTNRLPAIRYRFSNSGTLGHSKSPFFSIPEGLHFIYDPALWQLPVDSLFGKGASPGAAVKRYRQRIFQRFGVFPPTQLYAPILADELLNTNKTREALDMMQKEVELDPTNIELFAKLVAQLKRSNHPAYSALLEKLKNQFTLLKLSEQEKKEWLEWVAANSQ